MAFRESKFKIVTMKGSEEFLFYAGKGSKNFIGNENKIATIFSGIERMVSCCCRCRGMKDQQY
jgi:hypothetical protein